MSLYHKDQQSDPEEYFWNLAMKRTIRMLELIIVLLTVALPFLLQKPLAGLMALFTAVVWGHVCLAIRVLKRPSCDQSFVGKALVAVLTLVLIAGVVAYYIFT